MNRLIDISVHIVIFKLNYIINLALRDISRSLLSHSFNNIFYFEVYYTNFLTIIFRINLKDPLMFQLFLT
jgi:hypothetical protein